MTDIIVHSDKLMMYEALCTLSEDVGKPADFADKLWQELLACEDLYNEFKYFAKTGTIKGELKVEGYSVLDMFVYMMSYSNLKSDTGKNTALCNKTEMVLDSFAAMAELMNDPETFKKRLSEGRGMDRM